MDPTAYEFGPFRLEAASCRLLRDGEPLALPPKVFDALLLLVTNRDRVVPKQELMQHLWPDVFVQEDSLVRVIFLLRKALGDARFVETAARRGYRFAAEVRVLPNAAAVPVSIEPAGTPSRAPALRRSRRWLAIGLAVAVIALAAVAARWRARSNGGPTVAVLPFDRVSGGEEVEDLPLAIAERLVRKLGDAPLRVLPFGRTRTWARADPLQAGRTLETDLVLTGTVRGELGRRALITARLLRTSDGASLWAEAFDEKIADLEAVEESIVGAVRRSLKLSTTPEELRRRWGTSNAEAQNAYLTGLREWTSHTSAGRIRSLAAFKQAVELDPQYAAAWAWLGTVHFFSGQGDRTMPLIERALE